MFLDKNKDILRVPTSGHFRVSVTKQLTELVGRKVFMAHHHEKDVAIVASLVVMKFGEKASHNLMIQEASVDPSLAMGS